MPDQHIIIYTDGGCDPNPGTGGWAAVLCHGKRRKEISGGEAETTNNRMEMTAAIEALAALKRACSVELYTDSQYLRRGVTEWMPGWKRQDWTRGKKREPVKNADLWRRLDELNTRHQVEWKWVRGHTGNVHNERCDALASEAIAAVKRGLSANSTRTPSSSC
jgi:ribonuclease HI